MDSEEWKILKQAAIRFELKTGYSVNVTASRQGQTLYQFSSDRKTASDTRSIGQRGFSSMLATNPQSDYPMSYAGYELSRKTIHTAPTRRPEIDPSDDPFNDENQNQ